MFNAIVSRVAYFCLGFAAAAAYIFNFVVL